MINGPGTAPFLTILVPLEDWERELFNDAKIVKNGAMLTQIMVVVWFGNHSTTPSFNGAIEHVNYDRPKYINQNMAIYRLKTTPFLTILAPIENRGSHLSFGAKLVKNATQLFDNPLNEHAVE